MKYVYTNNFINIEKRKSYMYYVVILTFNLIIGNSALYTYANLTFEKFPRIIKQLYFCCLLFVWFPISPTMYFRLNNHDSNVLNVNNGIIIIFIFNTVTTIIYFQNVK